MKKKYGTLIDRNNKVMKKAYLDAFTENHINLTIDQWILLDILQENEGISQKQLALESHKNTATVSRIIDVLEGKGLVQVKQLKTDKRQYMLSLTSHGVKIVKAAEPIVENLRDRGWNGLSEEDYAVFVRLMDKIFDNYQLGK